VAYPNKTLARESKEIRRPAHNFPALAQVSHARTTQGEIVEDDSNKRDNHTHFPGVSHFLCRIPGRIRSPREHFGAPTSPLRATVGGLAEQSFGAIEQEIRRPVRNW
jgi:hypothetical protein